MWRSGLKNVVCLDEVGRGSLAGPVVACAVALNSKLQSRIKNLRDSKKLSPRQREKFYGIITNNPNIQWNTGKVYPKTIDRINILEATKLAMQRAVNNLELKTLNFKPDFLILDGKMKLRLPLPQKPIIKADEKVFSCAIASIIAKVRRDRIMQRYHLKYPQYGFDKNKGYGTDQHIKMLNKYGRCDIHRNSFHYHGRPKTKTH